MASDEFRVPSEEPRAFPGYYPLYWRPLFRLGY